MNSRAQIVSIHFTNYKAYKDYTVTLDAFNVLVGPNNAGKSTIIGSLRILTEGIRRARARASDMVDGPDGFEVHGYPIRLERLPVSTENVFHNYDDSSPATVQFRLSNGNSLTLFFPAAGQCAMIPEGNRIIRTPTDFKREFNVEVAFVPVLGPVEHNEVLKEKDTARNALLAHSASRNFRNIWYHFPDGFDEFRNTVKATWPGMDIQPPELTMRESKAILCMFCPENRIAREIFWAGFGFQVWCQMLTFIVQARKASLLIVDEPDIYLHADLQRQLVGILKNLGPDIVVATHSVEMIMEVESHSLLHVDKRFASARRVENTRSLQSLHAALGTALNSTLAQLTKTRRVIFVENPDYPILFRLARVMGFDAVANRSDFAVINVKGFEPRAVAQLATRLEETLGIRLLKIAVFERGSRSHEEVTWITGELERWCWHAVVLPWAGLANVLLNPAAIERAIVCRLAELERSAGAAPAWTWDAAALLGDLCEGLKAATEAQFTASRNGAALGLEDGFESQWASPEQRFRIVSADALLAAFNERLHDTVQISLSSAAIAQCVRAHEIWHEAVDLIRKLEAARTIVGHE